MPPVGIPELLILGALWALAIAIVVIIGRGVQSLLHPPDSAEDELRLRLARGEIDEVEYERLRSVLQRG